MPHPTRGRGKPVRLRAGDCVHIFYTDLGKEDERPVFDSLVKSGVPGECLKRPVSAGSLPRPVRPARDFPDQMDSALADAVWEVLTGPGTPAEKVVLISVLVLGGEVPEGPMCEVLADRLGCSPRLIYKATANRRPAPWKPSTP